MHVILLTHEREAIRPTNTGNIALQQFPEYCQRIMWSRVTPSQFLLDKLTESTTALLFPEVDSAALSQDEGSVNTAVESSASQCRASRNTDKVLKWPETVVILDATWQEARKMLRQSPYLKTANTFSLSDTPDSQFNLRRNQVEGGLCTLECIIELFKQAEMTDEAQLLTERFIDFCQLSVDD
ncbi:DTW domain-containing protein [Shewanella sp. 0m-8]